MAAVEQRQLGAGDGLDAGVDGVLGELHRPVQPVVVGRGQGRVPQVEGAPDQLLRLRRAVEEGEGRMEVQLDVRQW